MAASVAQMVVNLVLLRREFRPKLEPVLAPQGVREETVAAGSWRRSAWEPEHATA